MFIYVFCIIFKNYYEFYVVESLLLLLLLIFSIFYFWFLYSQITTTANINSFLCKLSYSKKCSSTILTTYFILLFNKFI